MIAILLLLEIGSLHGLELHILLIVAFLASFHHSLVLIRAVRMQLFAVIEDTSTIVLLEVEHSLLRLVFGRNDLNVTMAGQKLHIWWTVQQHFSWNWWQGISQRSELVITVSKAAVVLELADTGLLVISAHLSLVVGVNCTDVVTSWVLLRHGL